MVTLTLTFLLFVSVVMTAKAVPKRAVAWDQPAK